MKTFKVEIKQSHEFSQEDINDIVVTALEGGINYWCGRAKMKLNPDKTYFGVSAEDQENVKYASDIISLGGTLVLHDAESEDKWELDAEKLLKGIAMYCENHNYALSELMDGYDADTADAIVQYAVFNELTFG
jgi:hypothetical protein